MKSKLSKIFLTGAVASVLALCPGMKLQAASLPMQDPAQDAGPPAQQAPPGQAENAPLSEDQLRQLVAPIALYPDALVAQILAASAYPTQVVEAQRFVEAHPDLKGKALADEVDRQDWDPSVKALTAFPTVLANLNKDLSWTSELGDANVNQQADVMKAIQYMRHQAQKAGNLKTTPQQTVTDQGDDVEIQPAAPDVVYVPDYDPEFVYGYPVGLWPGFYPWWGVGGPYISFGLGFGIGPFLGFGWGWGGWGLDWPHYGLWYHGGPYAFHSRAFYDRNAYFHGGYHGGFAPSGRGDMGARGFAHGGGRGFAGTRSGAFSGFGHGGETRGFSARGRSSFGGGFHGGGGGRR